MNSLVNVLQQLPDRDCYSSPCSSLSDATIGQHTRHIIELYQCLTAGYQSGEINYDNRKRNPLYENDIDAAVSVIKDILLQLEQADKPVKIYCNSDEDTLCILSNYNREVLYNLEHCIHHQALIKVALLQIKDLAIAAGFGVAPSTLQYREKCAQ